MAKAALSGKPGKGGVQMHIGKCKNGGPQLSEKGGRQGDAWWPAGGIEENANTGKADQAFCTVESVFMSGARFSDLLETETGHAGISGAGPWERLWPFRC